MTSKWCNRIIINISTKFAIFISVHPNVNDNRSRFDKVSSHKLSTTDCNDKNIRLSSHLGKMMGA